MNRSQKSFKVVGQVSSEKVYIAFSSQIKNGKLYAKLIADEVVNMQKSGELDALLKNYGLSDWAPQ